jgi:proline dehydrogenase
VFTNQNILNRNDKKMLRSTLIYLSKADWARNIVMNWRFASKAASRFIAGEKLEDAIRVVRELNSKGINATLDHLGEHTHTPDESIRAADDIVKILEEVEEHGVASNVSIKLTQIGLALGDEICEKNLVRILTKARETQNFVRIDMEDSSYVDRTLLMYEKMRHKYHFDNTGVVIQAYLYRSEEDILRLLSFQTRIRLCKGAYKEPPDIAYPQKKDVDTAYDRLATCILDGSIEAGMPDISQNGKIPPMPAIASHDPNRLTYIKELADKRNYKKSAIEFQMLYGIRRDLQEETAKEGYPVRIYVPYGTQWYPYYVRRLAERPANIWFFISNFFRK